MIEPRPRRAADGVPLVPAPPLVGALPHLLGPDGLVSGFVRLARRYGDEGIFAVPLPLGGTKVFVCSAALAEEVVDDRLWEKAIDPLVVSTRRLVGNGLFSADSDDPAWTTAHRVLSPAFSGGAMARYVPTLFEVLDARIASWASAAGPIDVVSEMTALTLDAIARIGFDHRFARGRDAASDPFLVAFASALQEILDGPFRPPIVLPFEAYRALRFARDKRTIDGVVDRVIAERRAQPRERWPEDLLSRMLDEADPKTGARLDPLNVRYQVLTFLLAGHETTGTLLAFALHYVASDRELATRLADEAASVLGDEPPDHASIRRLDLAARVLDETLRLHPPAPFFMRKPRAPTRLGGRYAFTPSDEVAVMLPSVHRDPSVYPDPERFDPDRFLPAAVRARPIHAYRPFGTGRRICTGRSFALVEATLALSMIARAYTLEHPGPLRIRGTPLPKPHGFRLRVSPR